MPSTSQDTTPTVSRYTNERLAALWDRVESLEHVVEAAGAFLERAIEQGTAEIDAPLALKVLQAGMVQTFRSALLADRRSTDEQLDEWLAEIAKHEAKTAESEGQD